MKSFLFLIWCINLLFLLMSETLLLGYAQTIGILLLGIFTVVWNNRRKKENVEVKTEMGQIHTKIDGMRENELRVTKLLGETVGAEAGRQQMRAEVREDKIDSIGLPSASHEPVKVIIEQPENVEPVKVVVTKPADVNIVEDKTKAKK